MEMAIKIQGMDGLESLATLPDQVLNAFENKGGVL